MKSLHTTLAVALLAASGFASAAPAFEGGQASSGLTFEPAVTATQGGPAVGVTTAAAALEGGQAASGLTFEPNTTASLRTRAEVRAEGATAARSAHAVYDGGLSS